MLRRVLIAAVGLTLAGSVAAAPAALADGPSVTVGPVTISGLPGCC